MKETAALAGQNCPFCGSDRLKVQYKIEIQEILRCLSCDLMWLKNPPSMEHLKKVYNSDYFKNDNFFHSVNNLYGYTDYISERLNKQLKYVRLVKYARSLLSGIDSPTWLDVGCGLGYLLDAAIDQGFRVTGLEFNAWAVGECRKRYAFETIQGTLDDLDRNRKFDVISMIDVIEHFTNPFEQIAQAREALSDNGILVVMTMDCRSWMSRAIGKNLEDFRRIREHLFFFSRDNLITMMTKNGLTPVEVFYEGHTFRLGQLLERIAKPINATLQYIVNSWITELKLEELPVSINPQLKFTVIAVKGESTSGIKDDRYLGPLDEFFWIVFGLLIIAIWAVYYKLKHCF